MVHKIGLIRHYKVKHPLLKGGRYSAAEVTEWFRTYDQADIEEGSTALGETEWEACYVSSMPRALKTAKLIYDKELYVRSELREIPAPIFNFQVRLPFLIWALLIRFSFLFSRQTREDIRTAKMRLRAVLDEIMAAKDKNVLIITHAALMFYMRKELKKRGFSGPRFTFAENGKLYVFEHS